TSLNDITIHGWPWYEERNIRLYAGEAVVRIDTAAQRVYGAKGTCAAYDKLIIATGSLPFMLPLPGADKPNVTAFRNLEDCRRLIEDAKTNRKAVVIGGGLLGLEAARGLLNLGLEVSVVHIHDYLMERQLDRIASKMLQQQLERQGMRFLLNKSTEKIYGRRRAEGLQFQDGTKEPADNIVMAVGIRPNVKLAADSGIETNRAIVVNDLMETSVPNVYAVGECAEHRGIAY